VIHSGEVLLALTRAGILREDAYRIVQRNAMTTWEALGQPDARGFRENLLADPDVAGRITPAKIDAAMDPAMHLRAVDHVFERVFGREAA
jgi:adenylosuccinate lyase